MYRLSIITLFILSPFMLSPLTISTSSVSPSTQYEPHNAIAINNDSDFIEQGWPGLGTPENPYVIEGLSIISEEICVSISETNSHLIIRDCYFWSRCSYQFFHRGGEIAVEILNSKMYLCTLNFKLSV